MSRRAAGAVAAAALVGMAAAVPSSSADETKLEVKANAVELRMATSEPLSESALAAIGDLLFDSPARVSVKKARLGDGLSRARLVNALADGKLAGTEERFVIAGSPLTADEQAALTAAGQKLVRVPAHAAAVGFLLSGPNKGESAGFRTEGVDEFGFPTEGSKLDLDGLNQAVGTYTMKLPARSLAEMYLGVEGRGRFDDPAVAQLWGFEPDPANPGGYILPGTTERVIGNDGQPWFAVRFDPAAETLYLQRWIAEAYPELWAAKFPGRPAPPTPTEDFLGSATWRSRGVAALSDHLVDSRGDARSNFFQNFYRGTMAAAPMWVVGVTKEKDQANDLKLWTVEVPNANGDFVLPTSASISAAIAAGGETPFYALRNRVPGAYPFSWVESVYLPEKGLTIDETNAVSAFARLLVTDGQDIAKQDGDGVLPASLVAAALSSINSAVTSNCAAAGGEPVSQVGSPYYPAAEAAPKLAALPAQTVCATKVVVVATTTTTAATTTTTTAATTTTSTTSTTAVSTQGTVRANGTGGTSNRTTAPRSATTRATTAETTTPPTTAAAAAETTTTTAALAAPPPSESPPAPVDDAAPVRLVLPISLPSPGVQGFDRLMTMAMGGVVLLWLRRRFLGRRASAA